MNDTQCDHKIGHVGRRLLRLIGSRPKRSSQSEESPTTVEEVLAFLAGAAGSRPHFQRPG